MTNDKTTIGYSVNVVRADVVRAVKEIALKRLLEKSPGLVIDAVDWHAEAEVFLPDDILAVPVSLAR
jgi:hypothetical protein